MSSKIWREKIRAGKATPVADTFLQTSIGYMLFFSVMLLAGLTWAYLSIGAVLWAITLFLYLRKI